MFWPSSVSGCALSSAPQALSLALQAVLEAGDPEAHPLAALRTWKLWLLLTGQGTPAPTEVLFFQPAEPAALCRDILLANLRRESARLMLDSARLLLLWVHLPLGLCRRKHTNINAALKKKEVVVEHAKR